MLCLTISETFPLVGIRLSIVLQLFAKGFCVCQPVFAIVCKYCIDLSFNALTILNKFANATGAALGPGMAVIFEGYVQYSDIFGLSLIIEDIDPSFTVGEAFAARARTIARLEKEGMMELNSGLQMAPLPRRLAVISAPTAAGYGDFMDHLHNNPYGFKFESELFPAPLQGSEAPVGIIAALGQISDRKDDFDAALILRGGGSATDLACFDDYELALNIAQFPLPILTAIGHERDVHIADMVAFEHLKTPTALADFFVDIFATEDYQVQMLAGRLSLAVRTKAGEQRQRLERLVSRVRAASVAVVGGQRQKLSMLEYRIGALNPAAILAKGFSMTLKNGRRVTSAKELKRGEHITTVFPDGNVSSKIL